MTLEETLLHLKVDGWCVIEGVIPEDKVDELRESIEATTAAEGIEGGSKDLGYRPGIIAFNRSFVPYLSDGRLLGAAEALFGRGVKITSTSAIINMPGNERGIWHSDVPFNQNNLLHIPTPLPRRGHAPHLPVDVLTLLLRDRRHTDRTWQPPIVQQPHRRQRCGPVCALPDGNERHRGRGQRAIV